MNGKKAKALREMARRITVGADKTAYCSRKDNSRTILLAPGCTRRCYQQIKKEYYRQQKKAR